MRLPAALFLSLCLASTSAEAAVLETTVTPEMAEVGCTARLTGVIENGDLDRIRPFLDSSLVAHIDSPPPDHPLIYRNFTPSADYGPMAFFSHRLCLNSPGGSLSEAMRIVEYFRLQSTDGAEGGPAGIQTAVARGDRCESACSFVFFAGRFVRFSGNANYEGRSNHLLHPLGHLGLHAPFLPFADQRYSKAEVEQIWQIGMDATALISRQIANGNLFMSKGLFSELMTYLPDEMLVVETVGQAVKWDINVEPNKLSYAAYDLNVGQFFDSLCRNAAASAPALLELELLRRDLNLQQDDKGIVRSDPVFRDRLSGRSYRCVVASDYWQSFSRYRNGEFYADPMVRQRYTCPNHVVTLSTEVSCYDCEVEVETDCIAVFPPEMTLRDIHMDRPDGN